MKRIRTLQLARVGTWGTQSATLTKKDFEEMIETFSQSPVFLGHEAAHKDSEPSYGKVIGINLSDDGETLYGDVVLEPEVDRLFSDKKYDSWSIGCPRRKVDNKRVLHHLALLGSTKPAIPNLRQIKVIQSDYSEGVFDAEYAFQGNITEKEDDEMSDEEKKKMEALEKENASIKKELEDLKKQDGKTAPPSEGKSKEFADLEKEHEELKKRFEAKEKENRKGRVESFMKAVADRIPAGVKAKVGALAEQLAAVPAFNYADGDKEVEGYALNMFEDILAAMPAPVKTGGSGNDYSDKGSGGKAPDWNKTACKF